MGGDLQGPEELHQALVFPSGFLRLPLFLHLALGQRRGLHLQIDLSVDGGRKWGRQLGRQLGQLVGTDRDRGHSRFRR
jgi:hypothetical protein